MARAHCIGPSGSGIFQRSRAEYEAAGLDLLLLQMSPQREEMERFAAQVIGTRAVGSLGKAAA
jgi:hypothetical protein